MSVPVQNIQANMIQPQNIVINQVPLSHTMIGNATNGIPMSAAIGQQIEHHQKPELKQSMVVETMPIQSSNIGQNTSINSMTHSIKSSPSGALAASDNSQILSKQRLQDIIRDTDPTLILEDEVEEIILNYLDEFVDKVLNGASLIAKNRHGNTIEVKDVQQYLTRNYDMWTPGFGTDELKPLKRSFTAESHKQRLALIKKTIKKY